MSLTHKREYLNQDPNYTRDMKIQAAEQSLLGVWHAAVYKAFNLKVPYIL